LDCREWSIVYVFFFLFTILTTKVHNCPICLFFVNFSPQSLNFLFQPYSFYRSFVFFFNFVLQLQFFICFVFHFSPYFFNFLSYFYFFYSFNPSKFIPIFGWCFKSSLFWFFYFSHFLFCLSFICLQFSPSILICVYYVFQFNSSTFNFSFFHLALFLKFL